MVNKRKKHDDENSELIIGDLAIRVSGKRSLAKCKRTIKTLLKDKEIRDYLGFHNKKKLLGLENTYVG
jgi:hypothetical protein